MAISSYFAWWQNDKMFLADTKNSSSFSTIAVDQPQTSPSEITLVIDGDDFLRRTHPRPFSTQSKLKSILPNLLQSTLLAKADTAQFLTLFQTEGVQENKFISYSLDKKFTHKKTTQTAAYVGPVVRTIPAPFGGLGLVEKGKDAILITKNHTNKVTAIALKNGETVSEFRTMLQDKWHKEGVMTLLSWLEQMPSADVYASNSIAVPNNIETKSLPLPKDICEEDALVYGLRKVLNSQKENTVLPIKDAAANERINKQTKRFAPLLMLLIVATSATLANNIFKASQLDYKLTEVDDAMTRLFNEALPNTPSVDPVMQLQRRSNELSLLSGLTASSKSETLPEYMVILQEAVQSLELGATLDELSITHEQLRLRGTVPNLSDVETLQEAVLTVWPHANVQIQNVSVNKAGSADFVLEAKLNG